MSAGKAIRSNRPSPFRDHLGPEFKLIENGRSICELEIQEKHLNAGGSLHGGAAFTLIDAGMGHALRSVLPEDQSCVTVETKISYFNPASSGRLVCETRILHRGKRVAFLESEIRLGETIVAKATGTLSIVKGRD